MSAANLVNPLSQESNLLAAFQRDIEKAGLVGEKENAAVVFLAALSARLPAPVNLTVGGASSAGKNHLMSRVGYSFRRSFSTL
jgi:hypothetical protein